MNIAYIRVSTIGQNLGRQKEALEKYKIDKWVEEKASAKDTNRPQLQELLKWARKGDVVIIKDFSRLARSTKDLLELVELFREKEITLISDKENLDTSTSTGKLMLTMIAAINEFERSNLLERQKEGIELAKREGKYKGNGKVLIKKPTNWKEVYTKWKAKEITGLKAMELLNLKKDIFYKFVKEEEGK